MKTKQKILEALGIALDDVNEDRLLDILLDAYKAQKDQIVQLRGENAHERLCLQSDRDNMREEMRRIRHDSTYGSVGEYFFIINQHRIGVIVRAGHVSLYERIKNVDYSGQQMSRSEWEH